MRWLFILLLIFNIVYFGWELDRQIKLDVGNQVPHLKIPPDSHRLTLLSEYEAQSQLLKTDPGFGTMAPQESNQLPDVTDHDETGKEDKPADSVSQLVAELPEFNLSSMQTVSNETLCFTFGPVAEELQAITLSDWFKSRQAWSNIRHIDEKARQLFWVYLAPQESKQVAIKTIRELKNKGISDYRLISKGNLQNAISLGLFSSQAAVNSRLRELAQKGYNPVVVPYFNGKRVFWVDVKFVAEPDLSEQLINGYPSRYTSVPVDCDKVTR